MSGPREPVATAAVVLAATGVLIGVWALPTSGGEEPRRELPPPAEPVVRPDLQPTIPPVSRSPAGSLEPGDEGRHVRDRRSRPARAVRAAARRFLRGYLRWSSGHGPAVQLAPIDRGLGATLAARPPRLPAERRRRSPGRVISVVDEPPSGSRERVLAAVRDPEREYVLRLGLERRAGRWLVVEVSG